MIKLFAIPMICSVMSGPVMKDVSYHYEYGPQQAVVYNDESYQITLNADELNNYEFANFNNAICQNELSSYITNASLGVNVASGVDSDHSTYNGNVYADITINLGGGHQIWFNYYFDADFALGNGENAFTNIYQGEFLTFDDSLTLTFSNSSYAVLKSAIESDIQANQTSSMPSIQDLFAQVTSAINAFIGSLGDAFTQVTALFWDSTAATPGPTFLGLLVLIGVGVGLVYAAYRVIKGLLHRI